MDNHAQLSSVEFKQFFNIMDTNHSSNPVGHSPSSAQSELSVDTIKRALQELQMK